MENLQKGLRSLDERSYDILAKRWLYEEKKTLHELSEEYGISGGTDYTVREECTK